MIDKNMSLMSRMVRYWFNSSDDLANMRPASYESVVQFINDKNNEGYTFIFDESSNFTNILGLVADTHRFNGYRIKKMFVDNLHGTLGINWNNGGSL